MASLIRELKRRIAELEERHRSVPLAVLETELQRRPVTLSLSDGSEELPRIFRGSSLQGNVSEDDFVVSNLPTIRFDSETLRKIEEVAYGMFEIEEIRDAPRIPHYKPGILIHRGLELVKRGMAIATLTPSKFYIDRGYERVEDLAEALVKRVYMVETRPSFLSILIARLLRRLRRRPPS